ncbi:hypothetical protein [Nocardia takedensis]|nr:hypothetical protein [Nocardia takedensis]
MSVPGVVVAAAVAAFSAGAARGRRDAVFVRAELGAEFARMMRDARAGVS